ncbi:MAG: DsrE family protein [bacterium]
MEKLNILWINDNKHTVKYLLGMYTTNSIKNNWWDNITIIIWGGSNELIKNDVEVQELIIEMKSKGVVLEACKVCADNIGTTELLLNLGVDVKFMGAPMTQYIKGDNKFITI